MGAMASSLAPQGLLPTRKGSHGLPVASAAAWSRAARAFVESASPSVGPSSNLKAPRLRISSSRPPEPALPLVCSCLHRSSLLSEHPYLEKERARRADGRPNIACLGDPKRAGMLQQVKVAFVEKK